LVQRRQQQFWQQLNWVNGISIPSLRYTQLTALRRRGGAQSRFDVQTQERFAVVLLDVKNRLIGTQVITIGTATETLAPPVRFSER